MCALIATLAAIGNGCVDDPAVDTQTQAIVNGETKGAGEYGPVVSLSMGCSGTFVGPHHILTAAHCLPSCQTLGQVGCVLGSDTWSGASWAGLDGPFAATAYGGWWAWTGASYAVDRVVFPTPDQFAPGRPPPDVALLHTVQPYRPPGIRVMPASTLPGPGNLCDRYDGTAIELAGFSDNAGADSPERRVGDAAMQCDIEANGRAFKTGGESRTCAGDSGGPALLRGAYNRLEIAGVHSFGDDWLWTACPSDSGESGEAFIPRAFIDRHVPRFPEWAAMSGVKPAAGDFDGDDRTDLVLVGVPDGRIPVAFAQGVDDYRITFAIGTSAEQQFVTLSRVANARVTVIDVDGDGRDDLVLSGGLGWGSIPVAFSNGDGTFRITNVGNASFASLAATAGARTLGGDFTGDGRGDLAVTGIPGATTITLASSLGTTGAFAVSQVTAGQFPRWAATAGVQVVAGDFDGDHHTDLAAAGGAGWNSVPIAFSRGGSFVTSNFIVDSVPTLVRAAGAQLVAGDLDHDGKADLALTGGAGWTSIPVAFSRGDGSFTVTNPAVPGFPLEAATAGVRVLAGDFDGDGRADLALTGPAAWRELPTAFSLGRGAFRTTLNGI